MQYTNSLIQFQDSGSLFNFIEPNRVFENLARQGGEGSNTSRKRSRENELYSYIKVPALGRKIIKLEIYDADQFKSTEICKCNADICCQHIVKNIFKDDIYKAACELIDKMSEKICNENTKFF